MIPKPGDIVIVSNTYYVKKIRGLKGTVESVDSENKSVKIRLPIIPSCPYPMWTRSFSSLNLI